MKNCLKCNNTFPFKVIVDGVTRNLQNRKFCLECSPFGIHNTKNLLVDELYESDNKICPSCNIKKPREDFYTRREENRITFSSHCKECSKNKAMDWQRNTKKLAVDYMGGSCMCCGYDKYLGALEFHHKNPNEKDFTIGQRKNLSFGKLKPELDKCLLVCANCHKEIHGGIIKIPD